MFAIKSIVLAAIIGAAGLAGTLGTRTANADVCGPIYIVRPSVINNVPVYCALTYVPACAPVYTAPVYAPAYTISTSPTVIYQSPYAYSTLNCRPEIIVRDHRYDRDGHDHRDYDRRDYYNDGHRW